jgi:hypothetical protein
MQLLSTLSAYFHWVSKKKLSAIFSEKKAFKRARPVHFA